MDSTITRQILLRIENGDLSATDELLQLHRPRLRRMAKGRMEQRLMTRVDPSDVLQEAFVLAVSRLNRYLRDRPIAFYPWMKQMVEEVLVRLYRRHKHAKSRDYRVEVAMNEVAARLPENSAPEPVDTGRFNPMRLVAEAEYELKLHSAIAMLSVLDQEIIRLRHFQALTTQETAEVLGISQSAVKMRHFRAIERLRERIEQSHG